MENVQANDALEREQLEKNLVLQKCALMRFVESQRGENGNGADDGFESRNPNVCEVHAVGLLAVCSCSEGGGGSDPEDDASGDELDHSVPLAL